LLNWVRTETEGYKGVRIENFGTSFNDGLAFLALAHKFDPTLFDYDGTCNSQPSLKNAEQAIEFAEKHLGVPKLIEAKELVEGKDNLHINYSPPIKRRILRLLLANRNLNLVSVNRQSRYQGHRFVHFIVPARVQSY